MNNTTEEHEMLDYLIAELLPRKTEDTLGQLGFLLAVAALMDMRYPFTVGHSKRVARYAESIAVEMGLDSGFQEVLRFAGKVHDIGKVGIARTYLDKQGRLTRDEMKEIQKHPLISYDIIMDVTGLENVANIVLYHHERIDGHGYPLGLVGNSIPLGSRILCVADSFDAMTSERPYKSAMKIGAALEELEQGAGTQFDPDAVQAFIATFSRNNPDYSCDACADLFPYIPDRQDQERIDVENI
jgi:HD-GYP domain-containing protein (c-di-GMP phosphodiesterase class II)